VELGKSATFPGSLGYAIREDNTIIAGKGTTEKAYALCNIMDMPTSAMVFYYRKFTVRLSLRKTYINPPNSGGASPTKWTTWSSIIAFFMQNVDYLTLWLPIPNIVHL
jgi:hypothetical protein